MTIEELCERLQADGYPAELEIPDYSKLLEQAAQGPLHTPLAVPCLRISQPARVRVIIGIRSDTSEEEYAQLVEQLKRPK